MRFIIFPKIFVSCVYPPKSVVEMITFAIFAHQNFRPLLKFNPDRVPAKDHQLDRVKYRTTMRTADRPSHSKNATGINRIYSNILVDIDFPLTPSPAAVSPPSHRCFSPTISLLYCMRPGELYMCCALAKTTPSGRRPQCVHFKVPDYTYRSNII